MNDNEVLIDAHSRIVETARLLRSIGADLKHLVFKIEQQELTLAELQNDIENTFHKEEVAWAPS